MDNLEVLQRSILLRHMMAQAANDFVCRILCKASKMEDVKLAVDSLVTLAERQDVLNEIYAQATNSLGENPVVDFTKESSENLQNYLAQITDKIELLQAPEEMNSDIQILTRLEVSHLSRTSFINSMVNESGVGNLMQQLGVTKDYQPSIEVMELACITAALVISYNKTQVTATDIVLPGAPGSLYRPLR